MPIAAYQNYINVRPGIHCYHQVCYW